MFETAPRVAPNVGIVLAQGAARHPDRVAVLDGDTGATATYGELHEAACDVAAALAADGLAPGDRVGLAMPNGADLVACWFGIVYAGGTVVPISPAATDHERDVRLNHCRAVRLVAERPAAPAGHAVDAAAVPRPVDADATAMILYTSGTTGEPKGARIGHASLLHHTAALVHHTLDLTPADRVLGVLPMSHSYGCRITMLAPFYAGATTVMLPRFSASGALAAMAQHGVTWAPVVPTMLAAWAAVADDAAPTPTSLRWVLSAGAPLTDAVRTRAASRLGGAPVRQGYGMTEATFATIDAPKDSPTPRPGSVGRPVWGVSLRVVDDAGAPVPGGTVGRVEVRGPNVMQGYLDAPNATAERIVGGWVRSGDLGALSDDGYLTVVDRDKDVILCGGFTVYPSEVEAELTAQPGVLQAAVVGVPDDFYGERPVAVVVVVDRAQQTAERLAEAMATQLSKDKRPVRYVFADALPQSASGKILKRVLRRHVTSAPETTTLLWREIARSGEVS